MDDVLCPINSQRYSYRCRLRGEIEMAKKPMKMPPGKAKRKDMPMKKGGGKCK